MKTVLLVADSDWVRNDVDAALSLGDWEVHHLDDPRKAASVAAEIEPTVVAVDMQVGSMGGMAVVRDIRGALEPPKRPRMLLLLDRSADAFLARRAGADGSILKPFTAQDLRAALE